MIFARLTDLLRKLLTPREWRLFGKIVAILGMLWFLNFLEIAREFPPDMFLYGRF